MSAAAVEAGPDHAGEAGEMTQVRPIQTEEVEDTEEILPDGTVHHVHKVHRHSVKVTRKSLRSEDGQEQVVEEQHDIPGSGHEELVETYQDPPRAIHQEEEVEETLPDGTRVTRKVVVNRMLTHIHKHQESFDEGSADKQVEDVEYDEVVPGTESAFLGGIDSSSSDEYDDDEQKELSAHLTTDVREETEVLDDGTIVKKAFLTTEKTRQTRSRSGSIDRMETSRHIEEESITPSPRPRSPAEDRVAVSSSSVTAHLEENREDGTVERTLELVEDMLARGDLSGQIGDGPEGGDIQAGAHSADDEVQTHRVTMKKEVHTKTMLGYDGQEETTIREDSQVQQENEPPEELRQSMQEIINQFMTTDPQPAQLPPSAEDDQPQQISREESV